MVERTPRRADVLYSGDRYEPFSDTSHFLAVRKREREREREIGQHVCLVAYGQRVVSSKVL